MATDTDPKKRTGAAVTKIGADDRVTALLPDDQGTISARHSFCTRRPNGSWSPQKKRLPIIHGLCAGCSDNPSMTKPPFDFGPMLDANVARYTIGFITLDADNFRPLGSGTLVKTKGTQGVLTCAHVLHAISCHKEIGIVVFPVDRAKLQQQKTSVQRLVATAIEFSDQPYSAAGRDLAFVPLPLSFMASLGASASILDLDIHEARSLSPTPADTQSVEVIAGIVNEMTPPAAATGPRLLLKAEGLINVGRFIAERRSKGFDLLEFEPKPAPDFKLLTTYGAMSGGGMWRLYVRQQDDGDFSLVENRLVGVVFWETHPPPCNLIGHGPISVYGHLLTAIRSRWPRKTEASS